MSDFLLADGFGNLADGAHVAATDRSPLGSQWTGYAYDFVLTDRSDGRKWLSVATTGRVGLQSRSLGNASTAAICFRVYRGDATACVFIKLVNAAGTIGWIGINASGAVTYQNGGYSTLGANIVATSTDTIPTTTETFVEVRITLGDSAAGSVSFYMNGVLSNTVSGIDTCYLTGRTALQDIKFGENSESAAQCIIAGWKYGDIIIHTATSPIGDVGVYYRPVDADGADSDFTPSAGANYQCADEIGPDGDTTYNESDGTAGHRDSFETAGVSAMSVLSVGVLFRARKTDTGTATLLLGAAHGGSEDQSTAKALTEAYLTQIEFFDVCPSTSAAWSAAEVTAAELSYEVGA